MVLTGAEYATSAAAAAAVNTQLSMETTVLSYANSATDVATTVHGTDMGAGGTVTVLPRLAV